MGCGSSKSEDTSQPKSSEPDQPKPAESTKASSEPKTAKEPEKETKKEETKKEAAPVGDESFVKEALESHNELRAKHGAPAMTVAQDLVDYSQNWANNIAKRDQMEHSKCTLPSGGRVGENIYMCWSSDGNAKPNGKSACLSWYDEIKDYNFDSPGFAMNTGHFTQVVWKGSTELGIAYARSPKGSIYVVANYRPAGNMMGDFPDNVVPPS